jgi:hypothetical protein
MLATSTFPGEGGMGFKLRMRNSGDRWKCLVAFFCPFLIMPNRLLPLIFCDQLAEFSFSPLPGAPESGRRLLALIMQLNSYRGFATWANRVLSAGRP